MSQDDVRRVSAEGKASKDRRFNAKDFATIAEFVTDTLAQRKSRREDREKLWKDIDRQVAMTPETGHKRNADGSPDPQKAWMPELELPLQAQTLEMLTADARRLIFPSTGPWHAPHAALTDEYMNRVEFDSLIAGDENDLPSTINQDNADKLVQGAIEHWARQYDFKGNIDLINVEAFKYGMGMGRARMVTKRVFLNTARGLVKAKQRIPVLFPISVKNTYPDDSRHRLMNEGQLVGGSTVREWHQLLTDVHLAAQRGSSDPNDEDGGWMPDKLSGIDAEKDGTVKLVEMEGDFVVPRRTTENFYIPNAVVTVLIGRQGKKAVDRVVRMRFNKQPFTSFIEFPYHFEDVDAAYAASPLMKGHPMQKSAVSALSRLMEAAALQTQPPVSYDSEDREFAATGGPVVRPGAQWGSISDVVPHLMGETSSLFSVYAGLLQQYADVTGITAPRLGQQTVSHTTAFAKDAEIQRGVVRTVDYVRSMLSGPMVEWLHMAYIMGREELQRTTMYIDAYHAFVEIDKDDLPDRVVFEAPGAGLQADEQTAEQQRLQSAQLALQIDAQSIQLGNQPKVDLDALIEQVLRSGGWQDVDQLLSTEGARVQAPPGERPGVSGVPGVLSQGVE